MNRHGRGGSVSAGRVARPPVPEAFRTDRRSATRPVEPNTLQPGRWLYQDAQPNARAAAYERTHLERTLPETAVLQVALASGSSEARPRQSHNPVHAHSIHESPNNADTGTLGTKPLELTSCKTLRPGAAADKQQRPPVLAKVELFHRDMVRREIWRQKFDFIYRQVMEQEAPVDSLDDHRPSTTGNAINGDTPSQNSSSRRSRTDRGRGRNPSSVCTSIGSQRPSWLEEQVNSSIKGPLEAQQRQGLPQALACSGWRRSDVPKAARACARRVVSQHGSEVSQAVADNSVAWTTDSQAAASGGSTCRAAASGGSTDRAITAAGMARPVAMRGILRVSASLPALSQELAEIRDQYYGGDEVLLHEDVLHASNPRLFPLRPGHGRPFPLRSLVAVETP